MLYFLRVSCGELGKGNTKVPRRTGDCVAHFTHENMKCVCLNSTKLYIDLLILLHWYAFANMLWIGKPAFCE